MSCNENGTQPKEKKADNITQSKTPLTIDKSIPLRYYKCDYGKNQYDTILSSGSEHEVTEVWGVKKGDIIKLPILNKGTFDTNAIFRSAALHIKRRLPDIDLLSTSYTLERINERDSSNPRNWFIEVTFLYDKRGYYQTVPVLLDGRIILSSNE